MKTYEIGWTYGGSATVQAENPEAARAAFHLMSDKILADSLAFASEGPDIVSVEVVE